MPPLRRAARQRILQPPDLSVPSKLNGGYTVRTYGSSHAGGLDAIQVEVGDRLRKDENGSEVHEHFIDHLAHAISNLIPRYADAHILATFQNINLYGGGTPQVVLGQLQRRDATHDLRLRLGGGSLNRRRAEIRHDPGATGEPVAPRRAGILVLYDEDGHDYYLWVDTQGKLRISTMDPGDNSNLEDYQLRRLRAIGRHWYLSFVAYSLLGDQGAPGRSRWAVRGQFQSTRQWCRAVVEEGSEPDHILQLLLA